jgi:hypothetical protein
MARDPAAAVSKIRAQNRAVRDERERVDRALHPREEVVAQLRRRILEKGAAWDVPTGVLLGNDTMELPLALPVHRGHGEGLSREQQFESMIAAVMGDQLEAALVARLEPLYEGAGLVLGADERAARLAELDRKLWDLECDEEAAIRDAEARGLILPRRGDADPRAVLGLGFDAKVAA